MYRRVRTVAVSAVWLLCLALGPSGLAAPADEPTLRSTIAGLQQREGKLDTVRGVAVRHRCRTALDVELRRTWGQRSSPAPSAPRPRPRTTDAAEDPAQRLEAIDFALAQGRSRVDILALGLGGKAETDGQPPATPRGEPVTRRRLLTVSDTRTTTRYDEAIGSALVTTQVVSRAVTEAQPLNEPLLLGYRTQSWLQVLARALAAVGRPVPGLAPAGSDASGPPLPWLSVAALPARRIGQYNCLGLVATGRSSTKANDSVQVWLAEELGCAVICAETLTHWGQGDSWYRETFAGAGYQQVGPGCWLPSTSTVVNWMARDGKPEQLLSLDTCRFNDLSTAPARDEEFAVRLPLGTYVQDNAQGRQYWVGDVTPKAQRAICEADAALFDDLCGHQGGGK